MACALLVGSASAAVAQNVPCHVVLRELHKSELAGRLRGPEPGRVAAKLKVSTSWVDRCATLYGRRLKDRDVAASRRERQEELWETQEREEFSREEFETHGDVVTAPVPYRDKARLRMMVEREDEWEPYQANEWRVNPGKKWSPFLYDPHRSVPDDVEGLIRD